MLDSSLKDFVLIIYINKTIERRRYQTGFVSQLFGTAYAVYQVRVRISTCTPRIGAVLLNEPGPVFHSGDTANRLSGRLAFPLEIRNLFDGRDL